VGQRPTFAVEAGFGDASTNAPSGAVGGSAPFDWLKAPPDHANERERVSHANEPRLAEA
jgi:hypothetical protein